MSLENQVPAGPQTHTDPMPSISRDVHFVHAGVHYAAKVVKVWSRECVNLFVFPNGSDPLPFVGPTFQMGAVLTSVVYAAAERDVDYSWHWPERV